MLIHNKDDIEFVIEFPCLLAHSVCCGPQSLCLHFAARS